MSGNLSSAWEKVWGFSRENLRLEVTFLFGAVAVFISTVLVISSYCVFGVADAFVETECMVHLADHSGHYFSQVFLP